MGQPRYARAASNLEHLIEWLEERQAPVSDVTRDGVARARAACEAARVLVYKAVDEQDHGIDRNTVSLARIAMVRAERAVAELSMEIMGLEGMREYSTADRTLRYAMTGGLTAGSFELQLDMIATRILGLPADRRKKNVVPAAKESA